MFSEPPSHVPGCGEAVPGRGAVHRGRDQPPGPLCGQVRGMVEYENMLAMFGHAVHLQLVKLVKSQ